jgi:hypothetical protein
VHGTHGEVVAVRAERDRAALLALPASGYLVVQRTTRVVARDGFFSFEGRRYHVPEAAPGERVEIVLGPEELESTRPSMVAAWPGASAVGRRGSSRTRSRTRCRWPRSSTRCR